MFGTSDSYLGATIQAITYAITVLIVSCPCAVGLAVPMVIVIASGVAAERGVIFRSAEGIEIMYKTSHVVFDKTGTLTEGKLTVTREWYAEDQQSLAKSLLLGLVQGIKHPVSVAVAKHLGLQALRLADAIVLPLNTTHYALELEAYLDKSVWDSCLMRSSSVD